MHLPLYFEALEETKCTNGEKRVIFLYSPKVDANNMYTFEVYVSYTKNM